MQAGHKGEGRAPGATIPKGSGEKSETFDGCCHHCSGYGHRKSQRKLLDQEMSTKGKGKGKGEGRGLCYAGADKDDC